MAVFLISTLVFALVMVAMAVGVLRGRAPLKGSCGGLAAAGIDEPCEICGGDPARCDAPDGPGPGSGGAGGAGFHDASR